MAIAMLLLATACGDERQLGTPGFVEGFAGATVADDPAAALVGRDLLSAGGTAGDAATALFFTLAATKPAAAGLMASGLCLSYRADIDEHIAYRFAGPAGVRAMAALHARHGSLPWRQVIAPAEAMARFGTRLTKAFVDDWNAAAPADPAARAVYGDRPAVGAEVQNLALASLLGQIRVNGAGAFYSGGAAQALWPDLERAGMRIDRQQWRDSRPEVADSTRLPFGNHQVAVAPFAGSAGQQQAAIWPGLIDAGSVAALPGLLRQAAAAAPESSRQETGFVAVDRLGNSVACVLSMGRPFGTGRMVHGLFPATAGAAPSAGPVLVTNKPTLSFRGAAAGAGVPGWADGVTIEVLENQRILADALAMPRTVPGVSGGDLAEPGGGGSAMPARSATTQQRAALGRINAVFCPEGLPISPLTCSAGADPRGYGYAAVADVPGN
jgi:gamma-glutamyltranspeptidase/glutathione hydrolase